MLNTTFHTLFLNFKMFERDGTTIKKDLSFTYPQKAKTFSEVIKESVDTGKFVPGIFRVNAYKVSEGAFTSSADTATCEANLGEYNVYFPERITLSGPLSADLKVADVLISYFDQIAISKKFGNAPATTLQKAMAKVGESDLQLAVELGELRETVAMIRSPLKNLRQFFIADRSRNLGVLKRLLGKTSSFRNDDKRLGLTAGTTAASTWLEFRYGIRPLIKSLQDIIEYIEDKVATILDSSKLLRKASKREWSETKTIVVPGLFMAVGSLRHFVTIQDDYRVISKVYYKSALERTVSDELGLSLKYLPETIWELTRLSFVVDWLFSVGPWLGSLRVKPGVSILGNTTSRKLIRTITVKTQYNVNTTGKWFDVGEGSCKLKFYHRTINADVPATPLFLALSRMDYLKSLDAAALILQPLLQNIKRK